MKQPEKHPLQTHLTQFREMITQARRRAGRQQQELAEILGLDAHVLSRKLHGRDRAQLVHREVKQIIQTLASWDAITTREEAIELLTLMGLKKESFAPQEWETEPLKRLEAPVPAILAEAIRHRPSWPVPLTSYIPRNELEERIREHLRQRNVRLLTLSGTGGVGKTRLSLEILPSLEGDFPDGISFIPLDRLQDSALLPDTLSEALDLPESYAADKFAMLERLKIFLRYEHRLLVLDNFEHLLEARALVVELLSSCPHLKILVISRRVLNVYGEHSLLVPPLDTIEPASLHAMVNPLQNPAIRLFVERARTVASESLAINQQNIAAIASICLSLDGLPLAIELAAARCRLLTPQMLLDQLRDQRDLLQKGEGNLTAISLWRQEFHGTSRRQSSMQFSLDWSYRLLSEPLQHIFIRLSVLVGNWSSEAAHYICEYPREELQMNLEELVHQSLLRQLPIEEGILPHEPRFAFLKTVREYALARHINFTGYEATRQRHAHYYLKLAELLEPQLWSSQRSAAIQQLEREQENLHAALSWAVEQKDGTLAQRFCCLLGIYWEAHSQFTRGKQWLEVSLALGQASTPPVVHATCLLMASRLAIWEMSYPRSRDYAQQALTLYENAGDDIGRERALFQIGDSWHLEGEHKLATRYFEECLLLQRAIGQKRDYAFTLGRLGAISLLNGDTIHVEEQLREAIAIFRSCGERSGIGILLNYLGMLFLFEGRPSEALPSLHESLEIAYTEGYHYNLAMTLIIFGCVLGNIVGPILTAHLCGAAEMYFQQIGSSFPKGYQAIYRWYMAGIQSQANAQDWHHWWQEGKHLSMQQAILLASQKSAHVVLQEEIHFNGTK